MLLVRNGHQTLKTAISKPFTISTIKSKTNHFEKVGADNLNVISFFYIYKTGRSINHQTI